jgi:hypothetical protein
VVPVEAGIPWHPEMEGEHLGSGLLVFGRVFVCFARFDHIMTASHLPYGWKGFTSSRHNLIPQTGLA